MQTLEEKRKVHNESQKRYYQANKEKCRDIKQRCYDKNPEKYETKKKLWAETHKQHMKESHQKWNINNKDKKHVERITAKFQSLPFCEFCGDTNNLHKHHPDYAYPEIFVTCCSKCHRWLHNRRIEE